MFVDRVSVAPDKIAELPRWVRDVPSLRPLLAGADIPLTAALTFVVGENGSGKSTLVEAVAEQFGLDSRGGRAAVLGGNLDTPKTPLGEALRLGLTHRGLSMRRAPRRNRQGFFLRAETVVEMNERFGGNFGYWPQDVEAQSHGEGFFSIIDAMLNEPGFYVMDEPESALSFQSCLRLVAQLGELRDAGSQIVCATHSPILSAVPGAQIIEMLPSGATNTTWNELAVVGHWRQFLSHPQSYLDELVTPAPVVEQPKPPMSEADEREFIRRVRARIFGDD